MSVILLNISVTDTAATLTAKLSNGFQGSTVLRVIYGIVPDCDTNLSSSILGAAGDIVPSRLEGLLPGMSYCFAAFVLHGGVTLRVNGAFRSGELLCRLPKPIKDTAIVCTSLTCINDTLYNYTSLYSMFSRGAPTLTVQFHQLGVQRRRVCWGSKN